MKDPLAKVMTVLINRENLNLVAARRAQIWVYRNSIRLAMSIEIPQGQLHSIDCDSHAMTYTVCVLDTLRVPGALLASRFDLKIASSQPVLPGLC